MEQGFAKENPTEEQLEKYQKLKEDLDLALQEWEFLAAQLEAE